jgi:hypothetical protein
MSETQSTQPPAKPFEALIAETGLAQRLRARMDEFSRAMAAGDARDVFEIWRASRDALAAALDIIGESAGDEATGGRASFQ